LSSPLLQAIGVYLLVVLLGLVSGEYSLLWAFLCLTGYSVVAPLLAVKSVHFWRKLAVVFLSWAGLFLSLPPTCATLLGHRIGEDAMVFLFPMMLFPVALLGAVIARLVSRV